MSVIWVNMGIDVTTSKRSIRTAAEKKLGAKKIVILQPTVLRIVDFLSKQVKYKYTDLHIVTFNRYKLYTFDDAFHSEISIV
ncbi:unnamed protein product [Enterobius vermicularis]|uniref:Phage protein n=1 Tax=Enterobius vermicularis TaxID=51028 RepID=A0A0N4V853_ENTVE|nr:unnamed protein product [Enterobius vermicularis]